MDADELDDEYKPTRIRIPRVDDDVYLIINKTQAYQKKSGKATMKDIKQGVLELKAKPKPKHGELEL